MRHFYRTSLIPADVIVAADEFFTRLELAPTASAPRERSYAGPLGSLTLRVKPEGGHYTFIDVSTDQMGESRLDRNVKRFFVGLHRQRNPSHRLQASY
jgi:hypothetical protein